MKILIAYDGSKCADAALTSLLRAGLPRVADGLIVSVEAFVQRMPASEVMARGKESRLLGAGAATERGELARAACRWLADEFPEWNLRAEADLGSPATILLAKAEAWRPDLLVIGSHGHSPIRRFILGSVSQRIVKEVLCAVRVGRGNKREPGSPVCLVIGVDGSPGAEAAVQAVAAREWPAGTEAHLVAAVDEVVEEVFDYVEALNHQGWSWLMDTVETAEKTLLAAGLRVTPHIKTGRPQQVLLAEAEARKADCIFLGARGLTRWERFRLGSVSAAVTAQAHCSVEVLRPAAVENQI